MKINKDRLYIITWTFTAPKGDEPRKEIFGWEERQQFIERYMKLTEESWYALEVKAFTAIPTELDMETILNQI